MHFFVTDIEKTFSDQDADVVAEIIPRENRSEFCIKYLDIDKNEYINIETGQDYSHRQTVKTCITLWRDTLEEPEHVKRKTMFQILERIREEKENWSITNDKINFLRDEEDSGKYKTFLSAGLVIMLLKHMKIRPPLHVCLNNSVAGPTFKNLGGGVFFYKMFR